MSKIDEYFGYTAILIILVLVGIAFWAGTKSVSCERSLEEMSKSNQFISATKTEWAEVRE